MSSCRISNIIPECRYVVDGIRNIQLLDVKDFKGFAFENTGGNYDSCHVTRILTGFATKNTFIELVASESAKYNSSYQDGEYKHTLETYVSDLNAELLSNLHLATKNRYIVIYETISGRKLTFGYKYGATLSYVNQTTSGIGSIVTLTAVTNYPLFEIKRN